MDGILNIYKEKGYTSHDVVAIVRKKLKIKKVGHTGTLDPEAEGVLPVCIGKATKVTSFITEATKIYRATVTLGIETDTQDHTGTVIRQRNVKSTESEIRQAVLSFVGEYDQIPPMYSALKVNGKKLYELARQGKEIERNPRKITIYKIDIKSIKENNVDIVVECSKGTYIRTLCADIGEKLNCGAHMSQLIRLQSGLFNIESSIKLDELDNYINSNKLEHIITHIQEIFNDIQKIVIDKRFNKYLYNGNKLHQDYIKNINEVNIEVNSRYIIYDEEEKFIGLYEAKKIDNGVILKPIKIFI